MRWMRAFPLLPCVTITVLAACASLGGGPEEAPDPAADDDSAPTVDDDDSSAVDDDGNDEDPDDEDPDDDDSAVDDGSGRAPLHPDRPGGWTRSTYVFSQTRAVEDQQNDEWVQLGWFELDEDEVSSACGGSGPRVTRTFYRWAHDETYPVGTCEQDQKNGVDFRRWDHTGVDVDACPGSGGWVDDDGDPTADPFLFDCPAHVPAGFGDEVSRRTWVGWYDYDPAERALILKYDVNDACRKEYYRDLTHDAAGSLLGMKLDGARSGDTSATWRGIGGTHGYAYGSPAMISTSAPFDEGIQAIAERTFLMDAWRYREGRADGDPLQHYQVDDAVGYQPVSCGGSVWFDHSCVPGDGYAPYLPACADADPPKTAYLRFWVDPFPAQDSREHLYWAWHAHHAPNWTGCYHRGSHSNPLLQVVDAAGAFRGYVGVEIQRSAQTAGPGQVPPDAWLQTDYRVFRWIEGGFQEISD
jgi:hypothetical protein